MSRIKVLFSQNNSFKIVLILLIFFGISGNINDILLINGRYTLFEAVCTNFVYNYYIGAMIIGMIFMAIDTTRKYDTDYFWIMRYKNKEKYLENLLKTIWKNNFIIYLVAFLSVFITLYFQAYIYNCLITANYNFYVIPDYLYLIFLFIKVYLLLQLIVTIIILLWKVFSKKYSIILSGIVLLDMFLSTNYSSVVSLTNIRFNSNFYTSLVAYPSFMMEVCAYSFYCIILMIIIFILTYLFKNKSIDIGEVI